MLKLIVPKYYIVKRNQSLKLISETFLIPECVIVGVNNIKEELYEGQILKIPERKRNLYTVNMGDTKKLLCGSEENYAKINYTNVFYPGMKIWI